VEKSRGVALITGGARGIGLGISSAMAAAEFDLVINGRKPGSAVSAALEQLRRTGRTIVYVQGDVSSREDRARMVEAVDAGFGRIDVLVNNAGVAPEVRADILEATEESFDRLMAINLKGPYFLTQAVAKYMIAHRGAAGSGWRGRIINISSVSAEFASINRGDYCMTKAGVAMATQLWASRLAEFDIDAYEIRPGVVATDMTAGVKEKYDKLLAESLTLEKRWGTPEDIGRAAAALARGEIPYATGQVLTIDGGMSVRRL
jgi:3-oxoacyl-[acyl-carrier protein] reductase